MPTPEFQTGVNLHERKAINESPVDVEILKQSQLPNVEFNKGQLSIDGVAVDGVKDVEECFISSPGSEVIVFEKVKAVGNGFDRSNLVVLKLEPGKPPAVRHRFDSNTASFNSRLFSEKGHIVAINYNGNTQPEGGAAAFINGEILPGEPRTDYDPTEDVIQVNKRSGETDSITLKSLSRPEQKFPNIKIQGHRDFKVNGASWDINASEVLYYGGYKLVADPETQRVALLYGRDDNKPRQVIDNNRPWKNVVDDYNIRLDNGHVSARKIGGNLKEFNTLVIDDKIWQSPSDIHRIVDYEIAKSGKLAVVGQDNSGIRIYTGDTAGAQTRWEGKYKEVVKLAVDDKGSAAALARNHENDLVLSVDGVDVPFGDQVKIVQRFTMENGAVDIKYTNATGQVLEKRLKVKPEAEQVMAHKLAEQKRLESIRQLEGLMIGNNLTPEQVLTAVQERETVMADKQRLENRVNELNRALEKLGDEKDRAVANAEMQVNAAKESADNRIRQNNKAMSEFMGRIKAIITGAKRKFTGGYDIDVEGLKSELEKGIEG